MLQARKGGLGCCEGKGQPSVLNRGLRASLFTKVVFEKRLQGSKTTNQLCRHLEAQHFRKRVQSVHGLQVRVCLAWVIWKRKKIGSQCGWNRVGKMESRKNREVKGWSEQIDQELPIQWNHWYIPIQRSMSLLDTKIFQPAKPKVGKQNCCE